jgi:hypothetical protein
MLQEIEQWCVSWRWRPKDWIHRLPGPRRFSSLEHFFAPRSRLPSAGPSRSEFGDPADDLTSLTLNYVFFSLQRGLDLLAIRS